MEQDIYEPEFVSSVFDRCSGAYRNWSAVASFGFIRAWRRICVSGLNLPTLTKATGVDLMAGTGEAWPHLFTRFPDVANVTAIDISPGMHRLAIERLHKSHEDRITHLCANVLTMDLPLESADFAISTFGLKTFNAEQHVVFAHQLKRVLKAGAPFSLIEASDPIGWVARPIYRAYLDRALPQIERWFLNGAQDFAMIGTYTRNFGDGRTVLRALREAGLVANARYYAGGSAVRFCGFKPR